MDRWMENTEKMLQYFTSDKLMLPRKQNYGTKMNWEGMGILLYGLIFLQTTLWFFSFQCLSLFPLWSMCSPSNKWSAGYMGNVRTESVRGTEGVLTGWRGGEIELFVGLFWAPLPLLQMSICSPPSSKCWGCRWPTEEKHLLISPWPSNYLPIYSSAHLMTIHLIHSTILLPLLHPSNNQSINTSICAPIQQFIYPSMNLLIIHPFIYHLSIHPS